MAYFRWKNLIHDSQSHEIEFLTSLAASLYYRGGAAASFTAPSALFVCDDDGVVVVEVDESEDVARRTVQVRNNRG